MKVTGNCLAGVASVQLDVNGAHVVWALNGILRLQAEAVMDTASYLWPRREAKPEMIIKKYIELRRGILSPMEPNRGRPGLFL